MNRNRAKLLTLAGIFCCLLSLPSLIFDIADFYYLPLLFFVGGIVLIVLSLAYYTEK